MRGIALAGLTLLCLSCSLDEAPPPVAPHDLALSPRDAIGCYEIVSLEWTPDLPEDARKYHTPPRRFELTSELLWEPSYRRIRSRDGNTLYPIAHWRLTGDRELTTTWSTGFIGVELIVRRRSTHRHFYGCAEPLSDSGASPRHEGVVVFAPMRCT